MNSILHLVVVLVVSSSCAHAGDKNNKFLPGTSQPMKIPQSPKNNVVAKDPFMEPGTSPQYSYTTAPHMLTNHTHAHSFSASASSLSFSPPSDTTSPIPRSMSVTPTQSFSVSPPASSTGAYVYQPYLPSAPEQNPLSSSYGSSLPACAAATRQTAEQIAAQKVTDFKAFLMTFHDADRAKYVTPLLEVLNVDACLAVAKVAAVKGTTSSSDKKTRRNLSSLKKDNHVRINAQLALAALKAALPEEQKTKK